MASRGKLVVRVVVLFLWASVPDGSASEVLSKSIRCENIRQTYLYYSPEISPKHVPESSEETGSALPVVMLLHGAGDRAAHMVDAWRHFAAKHKIILLAPELPREEKYEQIAPQVFRCVVEDAKQWLHIDPQRVYLFGNSMGGYLAYDSAMFESQYFAAVAVHAMRIADEYAWIVDRAQRKTPIAIYIGDRDQYFSVASVLKTRDLLRKAGFPVHYVEMINHDHDYYAGSDEINA